MKKKIAAVSMVKNECDIIELFVRINSRIFDTIYILDHRSDDCTPQIVHLLIKEGYRLSYHLLPDVPYNQSDITTSAVRQIANLNQFDYVCPIDADEFLIESEVYDNNSNGNIYSLPLDRHGSFTWRTYCPINLNYFKEAAPIYNCFAPSAKEPRPITKTILGNEFAKNCTLSMGNHIAFHNVLNSEPVELSFKSNHFPIRSPDQLIRKVIMGSYSFMLKPGRKPGEGFHWDLLASKIRELDYNLSLKILQNEALNYGSNNDSICTNIDIGGKRIGTENDRIIYKEKSIPNVLSSMDSLIQKLLTKPTDVKI